ncbi:melanoma inhibitory activity protein 2 isoform X3 [Bubalus bubalis]|uniref:melanoma inhibitory activity protein 2 isoform X3 n=1 Tax=Bubalus bubalis TaxID=89462 RepID=UPI001E1B8244|nr:melanoma inhibitory activity protein 2 isoform X3 [Bubalus bubalis]
MADLKIHRIFLLVISLTKCLESTKLLADFKKCGDLECEALISRVFAIRDYRGPDCRYLNFTKGEEISVYVKLSGKREDLWAGSKGKDFGYFPRDAVQIEEVFISEEVQIPTKESDFFCLLGISYIFENEASELNSDNGENMYPYEEDNDPKSNVYESDFQIEPGFYSTSESSLFEDQFPASEAPEDIRSTSELEDWEAEAESIEQYLIPEEVHVPPSSAVPEVKGWFGFGKDQAEEKPFESVTEPQEESSFLSRQIAVEDGNDPEELNGGEPQTEPKQELELEFDSVPKEQSELLVSELEHILNPQDTGWFGGGFTSYLGFGGEDTELELSSKESNPPLEDVPSSISSEEEPIVPCTEILTEKEDVITNESSILKPSWFDFGFAMLGFAYANEDKMISDDGKNEEGGEEDKHRHPSTSEFDPDKEQEIKLIKVTETENQIGKERVLEKTEDSDTVPYFKKLLYNFDNRWRFQNTPKETELTFPKQTLDESNVGENDKTEEFSAEKYPTTDNIEDTLKSGYSQPDMDSEIQFPMRIIEEAHFKTLSSENSDEKLKISLDTERPTQVEMDTSMENTLSNSQILLTDYSLSSQNYIAKKEDASWRQLLEYLFQIDVYDFLNSAFSPIVILIEGAVAALPEDMRQSNFYGFPWELVICGTIVGFFAVLLFLWRSFRSVRSRLYVGREKKLAVELSTLIEEKCKLLEKFSIVQKEYESLESSLKDASYEKESTEAQSLEAFYEKLTESKSELEDEILILEKELKEEKSKHSKQDELMSEISKRIQSLEDESKSLKSQVAEAKTTFKIFQMNEERLKIAIKDALSENSQLQESQKQLLQEAEEWREQVNELNKQKITFEDSKVHVEQVLCDKENQIKSLTERLRKMKDWTAVLGEEIADDDNLEWEMKSDSENDAHLDNQPKGALKKLIHAAKLRASLKTLEGERNQIYTQLSEVDKTKEELTECIKNLQTEQASLQSENTQFENETQKLQQKLKVMTELYQENEMILHRKLTMEENYRLEKEEKLSKADEKINHAAEELETYRKRAKDLEEELERTIHSYQGQIISHEKKAHDNWLAARTAERNLNDLRKENAHNRQKLTETEFKIELLEKDPYALDVPNTAFGREHSPYGPSPLGRPSPEMRAFLSPPTLLEGPLRLSPLLPGGGGRGSRGPGNPLDHPITNERGESNSDRLTDPHRASSDTGSLSPPWEQDRRMIIPPSGQPYPDPVLLLQRQDRFYSNSGRLSGPAELRSFNMPSLDKTVLILDGPVSSEMESSRNESKDDLGNLNVPDSSLPIENEATGPGFVPPPRPPVRVPLFPMDTRGPFIRRGPPFPPPPPGSMYGGPRDYFPPRDFPGPPPPPFAMRNVYPPRGFPHYLPPRPGFFPPPPHPESRSEFPSGLVPPSNEPTTEHPEPPQEP